MRLKSYIKMELGRLAETYRVARFLTQPTMWNLLKSMERVKTIDYRQLSNHIEIPNSWARDGDGLKCYLAVTQSHIYLILKRPNSTQYARKVLDDELGKFIDNVYTEEVTVWDLREDSFNDVVERIKLRVDKKLENIAYNLGAVKL